MPTVVALGIALASSEPGEVPVLEWVGHLACLVYSRLSEENRHGFVRLMCDLGTQSLTSGSQQAPVTLSATPMLIYAFRCDPDGSCSYIDPRWREVIMDAPFRDRAWVNYVHPDDRDMVIHAFERGVARQIPTTYACRVRSYCGYVSITVAMRPVVESGRLLGFAGTLRVPAAEVPMSTMHGTG